MLDHWLTRSGLCLLLVADAAFARDPAVVARDEAAIRNVFGTYRDAVMNDRGQEAARQLATSVALRYERVRDLALHAPRAELATLPTMELVNVLMVRQRIPAAELRRMSGVALIEHALDHGWIGKQSVAGFRVDHVDVVGDSAVARIVSTSEDGSARLPFVREVSGWRIDLLATMREASLAFDLRARQQGLGRDEFVFMLLSSIGDRRADESLWEPPLPRPATD